MSAEVFEVVEVGKLALPALSAASSSSELKEEKKQKKKSRLSDDDDGARNRAPKRPPLDDAKEEFLLRLKERHGSAVDPEGILADVIQQLGRVGELGRFLEFDSKQTTKPKALRNPAGHYHTLVVKFRQRDAELSESQIKQYLRSPNQNEPEPAPVCPLGRCKGNGEIEDEQGQIHPCPCPAGQQLPERVLRAYEEYNALIGKQVAV